MVSFAYFQAFKFPDSMNVHFQCVIQVCRYNCPEPKCGHPGLEYGAPASGLSQEYGAPLHQGLSSEYGAPPSSEYGIPPAFPDPRHPSGPAGAYRYINCQIVFFFQNNFNSVIVSNASFMSILSAASPIQTSFRHRKLKLHPPRRAPLRGTRRRPAARRKAHRTTSTCRRLLHLVTRRRTTLSRGKEPWAPTSSRATWPPLAVDQGQSRDCRPSCEASGDEDTLKTWKTTKT